MCPRLLNKDKTVICDGLNYIKGNPLPLLLFFLFFISTYLFFLIKIETKYFAIF